MSPYANRPARTFWKSGVAADLPTRTALYEKRFVIAKTDRIATAGSCFAQHIARNFRQRGYTILDTEPSPPLLSPEDATRFGFGLYSARYGNIYTSRQLLQLLQETFEGRDPGDIVWERGGRYFDALRPAVEPGGLASPEEVLAHRRSHIGKVAKLFRETDVFVFTFGLTETWMDTASETVFPTAPGTIAGSFDPARFQFRNLDYFDVWRDFVAVRRILRAINPAMRFLVTVSPVPLTATATEQHVLAATVYSKSVLRAVAGRAYDVFDDVDYFPSYEIIGTPFMRTNFYSDSLREVADEGVSAVMQAFFAEHGGADAAAPSAPLPAARRGSDRESEGVVCEDMLLDAFGA
ncbi:GSCFA domain-containing protein [Sphingomonas sp. NBWT7]|nr:GSCFA domain-containing protein [Sphingomonas sp. NBWT7]